MGLNYKTTFAMKTINAELRSPIFWRDAIVEMITCTILTIFVMIILITCHSASYTPNVMHFGIFAAFFVYLLIEGYGPICGATINPAACFALCASGHITWFRAIVFIIAELVGTAAGSGLGYLLNPADKRWPFPSLKPSESLTDVQCVFIEAVLTFNLLFVAISVNDSKNRPSVNLPSLVVGMCIGMGIMTAGTHTGGLQNPIIPLGPAIMNRDFRRHWIYWVGPCLGGTAGALTYELVQWIKVRFAPKPVIKPEHTIGILAAEHHNEHSDNHGGDPERSAEDRTHHFIRNNHETHHNENRHNGINYNDTYHNENHHTAIYLNETRPNLTHHNETHHMGTNPTHLGNKHTDQMPVQENPASVGDTTSANDPSRLTLGKN
jgi:glycerol uptake facilitator-like aquaporin